MDGTRNARAPRPRILKSPRPEILRVIVALLCGDPLWYDVSPQVIAINTVNTPTTLPMGLASARVRRILLRLNGSWSSPITAILKSAAGTELQRMTMATSEKFSFTIGTLPKA